MMIPDRSILIDGRPVRGHAVITDDGIEFSEGPSRDVPDVRGVIVPSLVDTHTHCADAGVKVTPGMTLEELVAPPDGLKHVYLRSTPRDVLVRDMAGFESSARSNGIGTFIDFREGGAEGCRMAREACPSAVILGRPLSQEFDPEEVEEILSVADGIALSSISDIDPAYAERCAEAAHRAGKTFAIHCSERVREDLDLVLSLEPDFLVHMVEATDPDLKRCADLDIPVSVCPRSNRFFGKVPPLRRMMDLGVTVAMGTDNAMLCTPDLRPEAELFREVLGDDRECLDWTWRCMCDFGRKLLYRTRGIITHAYADGLAVLPTEGGPPENAWSSSDRVGTFRH
ncbi:MAG: amidohydrolase family protein [archaeon]|nr:amidohydrolase family protein [archaeon]